MKIVPDVFAATVSKVAITVPLDSSFDSQPFVKTLTGRFSTSDDSYKFELRSDGNGAVIYTDCPSDTEEFFHDIDIDALSTEIEGLIKNEIAFRCESGDDAQDESDIREEITNEHLEEVFWDKINAGLEDPFFRSDYDDFEANEELSCECGTIEELIEFLQLCLLTEYEIKTDEDCLIVDAETEYESASIGDGGYWSERINELVDIACEHFKPRGCRYDYNDGCYDRYSGYSMSSESICIDLKDVVCAPARARMSGAKRLRQKLTAMQVSPNVISKLTSF